MSPALLDYPCLLEHLGAARRRFDVEWLPQCSSTNSVLLERAGRGAPSGLVLGCDAQSAGRGRRGRSWLASPGCSLTFSLLWRLPRGRAATGLSLVVGLAIVRACEALGIKGAGLKWPNDIWLDGRKLGGVLIEVAYDSDGLGLIIGIGLNLHTDPAWHGELAQGCAALAEAGFSGPREAVLGAVLAALAETLDSFARHGFAPHREAWNQRHALHGARVRVSGENGEHEGLCGNAAADGSLMLHTGADIHLLISGGDVSLIRLPA